MAPVGAPAAPPGGVVVSKPKSDVYTVMLILSVLAILLAILCLYFEMRAYNFDYKATEATLRTAAAEPAGWTAGWRSPLQA